MSHVGAHLDGGYGSIVGSPRVLVASADYPYDAIAAFDRIMTQRRKDGS